MNVTEMISSIEFHQLTQKYVLGICAALGLLVGVTFLYSITQWHDDWVIAHQEIHAIPTVAASNETANMIAAIPDAHLFGKSFSNGGEVPITSLQLRVTGIVKVEGEGGSANSKAYISIAGAPSKIYQIGDSLPYGVKVYDITANEVILENDSRLEKLPLPREKLEFKPRYIQERD